MNVRRNHAEKKIMMAVGNISPSFFLHWWFLKRQYISAGMWHFCMFWISFWREKLTIHGRNKRKSIENQFECISDFKVQFYLPSKKSSFTSKPYSYDRIKNIAFMTKNTKNLIANKLISNNFYNLFYWAPSTF